jgi:hypothetical protein
MLTRLVGSRARLPQIILRGALVAHSTSPATPAAHHLHAHTRASSNHLAVEKYNVFGSHRYRDRFFALPSRMPNMTQNRSE